MCTAAVQLVYGSECCKEEGGNFMLKLPELVSWVAQLMKKQLDAEANQQALPTTAKTVAAYEDISYQGHCSY